MKRLPLILVLLFIAVSAFAMEYAASAFHMYPITKSYKLSVSGKHGITINPTAATSVYLNGTGDDWTIAANGTYDLYIFRNISTVVFTCASTAAASPNKIRVANY